MYYVMSDVWARFSFVWFQTHASVPWCDVALPLLCLPACISEADRFYFLSMPDRVAISTGRAAAEWLYWNSEPDLLGFNDIE